jgi:hypothetical protein
MMWQQEVKSIVHPTRKHISSDQEGVLYTHHQTSAMRGSNLRLNDRHSHGEESHTHSLDGAACDESCETRREHLNKRAEEVDESADANTLLSADHVPKSTRYERSYRGRCLQTRNRDACNRGIDPACGPVGSSIVFEKAIYKHFIDQQAGHDAY